MRCLYADCGEEAAYIIWLGTLQLPLCKKHYSRLLKALADLAYKHGEASLEDLEVKREGGKYKIYVRKDGRKLKAGSEI